MTKSYTVSSSLSFSSELVDMISLDRNYCDVINLLFVLPGLYLNILKTEKILQFWDKKFSTSFQRKRLKSRRKIPSASPGRNKYIGTLESMVAMQETMRMITVERS